MVEEKVRFCAERRIRERSNRDDVVKKVKTVLEESGCKYGEVFKILRAVADDYDKAINQMLVRELSRAKTERNIT